MRGWSCRHERESRDKRARQPPKEDHHPRRRQRSARREQASQRQQAAGSCGQTATVSSQGQGGRRVSARQSIQWEGWHTAADGAAGAARSRKHAEEPAEPGRTGGGDPEEAQVTVISRSSTRDVAALFQSCVHVYLHIFLFFYFFSCGPLFSSSPTLNVLWLPTLGYSLQWISTMWTVKTLSSLFPPLKSLEFLWFWWWHPLTQSPKIFLYYNYIALLWGVFSTVQTSVPVRDGNPHNWTISSEMWLTVWVTATVPCAFAICSSHWPGLRFGDLTELCFLISPSLP